MLGDWSTDGSRLLTTSDHEDDLRHWRHPYTVRADDDSPRRITEEAGVHASPVWSPDYASIALHADHRLYVMSADGTDSRQLTRPTPALDGVPG